MGPGNIRAQIDKLLHNPVNFSLSAHVVSGERTAIQPHANRQQPCGVRKREDVFVGIIVADVDCPGAPTLLNLSFER